MSKFFNQTIVAIIAIVSLNPPAYGNHQSKTTVYPSIISAVQTPPRKMTFVKHSIELRIPDSDKAISQLIIRVPPSLKVGNNITIHNELNEKITADILVSENIVIINFPHPPASNSVLEIDLNGVKIIGGHNVFTYRVLAKLVGLDPELNLGVAEIRTFR